MMSRVSSSVDSNLGGSWRMRCPVGQRRAVDDEGGRRCQPRGDLDVGGDGADVSDDVVLERRDDGAVEAVELGQLGDECVGGLASPAPRCP